MRRAHKRRDTNEPEIRDALHSKGHQTWQVSGWGQPDLIVRECVCGTCEAHNSEDKRVYRCASQVYRVCEVKTAIGKRTSAQKSVPWPIVRNIEEAWKLVGIGTGGHHAD